MGSRDIKRKIKSVNSTMQITKAMELISTAKLKRNKNRLDITKPYFETVRETVSEIIATEKSLKHDFLQVRAVRKTLYIVITADRGLCGGYNTNATKITTTDIDKKHNAKLLTIGKKGRDFFAARGYDIHKSLVFISEKPSFLDAQDIAREALKLYKNEEVDEIKLVYTRLISTISQEATILNLLPIVPEEGAEKQERDEYVTYEPSPEVVLDFLIPKYIESTIFGALIESSAAEQAARRIAMESASDNAVDMISNLTLSYNKARQAAITQEISEIVSGAEALK